MRQEEFSLELKEQFLKLYNNHIEICKDILKKERCVLPILVVNNGIDSKLISFQPQNGIVDYDKALQKAKDYLNTQNYETAIFSYSSDKIINKSNVLVIHLFDSSNISVLYYVKYHFKGIFNKKVIFEEQIINI